MNLQCLPECATIKPFNLSFVNYSEKKHLSLFSFPTSSVRNEFYHKLHLLLSYLKGGPGPFDLILDPPQGKSSQALSGETHGTCLYTQAKPNRTDKICHHVVPLVQLVKLA